MLQFRPCRKFTRRTPVRRVSLATLGVFAALSCSITWGQHSHTGPVTGVADGDTLYMNVNGQNTRMRLANIDAPEKGQPFSVQSERALRALVQGQQVQATWSQLDRYGRPLVVLEAAGNNVNRAMVAQGWAWVYTQYNADPASVGLQQQAQQAKLGLWADTGQPVPPWQWRAAKRRGQ